MTVAELEEVTNALLRSAKEQEDKAAAPKPMAVQVGAEASTTFHRIPSPSHAYSPLLSRPRAVQVGAALKEKYDLAADKASFISNLVREWDPNRDGNIR